MKEILIKFGGSEYRCRPTYDVLMNIENKVMLSELAQRLVVGSSDGNVPITHVNWVIFCLLRSAAAPVTPELVYEANKRNEFDQEMIVKVMGFIIEEAFGTGPSEDPVIDEDDSEKKA